MEAQRAAPSLSGIAPQFLVGDLDRAIEYYCNALGFQCDFIYDEFYASVSRDGYAIHLKHATVPAEDRERRRREEHLDAYVSVSGVRALLGELETRGARVIQALEEQPWDCTDFQIEDLDGHVLCFSERREG